MQDQNFFIDKLFQKYQQQLQKKQRQQLQKKQQLQIYTNFYTITLNFLTFIKNSMGSLNSLAKFVYNSDTGRRFVS